MSSQNVFEELSKAQFFSQEEFDEHMRQLLAGLGLEHTERMYDFQVTPQVVDYGPTVVVEATELPLVAERVTFTIVEHEP